MAEKQQQQQHGERGLFFVCFFLGRQEVERMLSRLIPVIVESKLGKMEKGDKEQGES